jgi:phosphoribosylglycinamide formyltransferase-1
MKNIVIFISGRGSNMHAILESTKSGILRDVCTVSAVISNNAEAKGLETAAESGVETKIVPSKNRDSESYTAQLIETVLVYNPDLIVLAGYMKILKPAFIEAFSGKIINIHPADTKQHQGLHAYEWAFENKLNKTYITVHYVDAGVDTGVIIGQAEVDLTNAETLAEVEKRGLAVEHTFYSRMIKKIITQREE